MLFYRQNDVSNVKELIKTGRGLDKRKNSPRRPGAPPGGAPGALRLRRSAIKETKKITEAGRELAIGLSSPEKYWGSLLLGREARSHFDRAAALAPESAWPHLLAAMSLEMGRRYVQATLRLDKAIALRPGWGWPFILRGVCRWYLAQFREAAADLRTASRLMPESELPLLLLARAKSDLRDPSMTRDLDRALALKPRSGFVLSWRGRALFVLSRMPGALKDLRHSIKALPRYDRGWSWLGVSCAELGRWREAERLLTRARKLNPYYPTTLYPLARARMELGRWSDAGRALREAARIDRQGIWVEHRINMAHENPACLRSIADLDRYLARRPRTPWAWAWRGQTKLLLGRFLAARQDLDHAVKLAPSDPWARIWRAEVWRRQGYTAKAFADYRKASRLAPALSWPLAGLGWCLLESGQPMAALGSLNRSLRLHSRCAEALVWKGQALLELRRPREAVDALREAAELQPHGPWLKLLLARAAARAGDFQGALEPLRAFSSNGGSASDRIWAMIGWLESRLGREGESLAALAQALRLNPRQPLALAATACWWRRQGQPTAARAALEAARISGPAGAKWAARMDSRIQIDSRAAEELYRAEFSDKTLPDESLAPRLPVAARRLWKLGRSAEALLILKQGGKEAEDHLLRAWLCLEAGRAEDAVEAASAALSISLDPENPSALRLRRLAKLKLGDDRAAEQDALRLRRLGGMFAYARKPPAGNRSTNYAGKI